MPEFNTEAPVPETDGGTPVLNPSGGVDHAADEARAESTPAEGGEGVA